MEGSGEKAGQPAPPRGLDPRTVAACFPKTGGGSGRRRGGGVRREGFHSSVSLAPTPFLRRESGRTAGRPGWWWRGEGVPRQKELVPLRRGVREPAGRGLLDPG